MFCGGIIGGRLSLKGNVPHVARNVWGRGMVPLSLSFSFFVGSTRCKQRAVHCIFAELLLYDNLAATTSGMLDEADLRVNLLADLRSMADHAYLAALGGL